MKNIRTIPPMPKENKKMRVAAYCRVNTFGPIKMPSKLQKVYFKIINNR